MGGGRRSFLVALAVIAYLAVAAERALAESGLAAGGLGALVLVVGWWLAAPPARTADHIDPSARAAARLVVAGAGAAGVTWMGPASAPFEAARSVAIGVACAAALLALGRMRSLGGIAARETRRGWDAVAFAAAPWVLAAALSVLRALRPESLRDVDPFAKAYAATAASLASLGVTAVAAFRAFALRRFELGVAERAAAAVSVAALCLAVALLAALMGVAPPEELAPAAALAAAVGTTACAVSQRATLVARVLRLGVALTLLCAPVMSVAAVVAHQAPTHAGAVVFAATAAGGLCGLMARALAAWLAPERGAWLRVLGAAVRAAKQPDPQQAVTGVLSAIRDGLGEGGARAALHRLASNDRVYADRAGYPHTEPAGVPPELVALAEGEPERVLSAETLRAVQVERADVRPVLAWLDAHGAAAATLVLDEEVCVGVLLWPAAGRDSPLVSEEVTGLRVLADHLGAITGAAAQLARSRAREVEAEAELRRAAQEAGRLDRMLDGERRRRRALAELLARPARVASYGPAAQAALGEAERLGATSGALALVVPPGVDAVAWAAVAHLASPRAEGPLVVADGAEAALQKLAAWTDPESAVELARAGTLVVLDAHLLAPDAQRFVASAVVDPSALVAVMPAPADELRAQSRLEERLADRLAGRTVRVPALAERAEDLRGLALYKLVRIGQRVRGEALGLSERAQALVNEHDWPGNDVELEAALLRAALRARGNVVDAEHLAPFLAHAEPPARSAKALG
jgi:hypothetical protein